MTLAVTLRASTPPQISKILSARRPAPKRSNRISGDGLTKFGKPGDPRKNRGSKTRASGRYANLDNVDADTLEPGRSSSAVDPIEFPRRALKINAADAAEVRADAANRRADDELSPGHGPGGTSIGD